MASSTARRARRSRAQWIELVEKFERSELGVQVFCDQHGIGCSTFRKWRPQFPKQMRAMHQEPLIELTTVPHPAPGWDLELDLGAGVILRMRRG